MNVPSLYLILLHKKRILINPLGGTKFDLLWDSILKYVKDKIWKHSSIKIKCQWWDYSHEYLWGAWQSTCRYLKCTSEMDFERQWLQEPWHVFPELLAEAVNRKTRRCGQCAQTDLQRWVKILIKPWVPEAHSTVAILHACAHQCTKMVLSEVRRFWRDVKFTQKTSFWNTLWPEYHTHTEIVDTVVIVTLSAPSSETWKIR